MARQALGKGLSALIPTQLQNIQGAGPSSEIPLDKIRPNRFQPRQTFSEAELKELADSISAQGMLQPILVRRDGQGYELISGERRFRAAQALGHKSVPAVVKEKATDEEMAEWALVENVQRANLNPIEEARGYRRLMDEFKLTQEQVAQKVGKDRATIANAVRLLKLPEEVQRLVHEDKLSMGHARALLGLENLAGGQAGLVTVARKAASEGWSVRQVEQAAQVAKQPKSGKVTVLRDIHLAQLEESLCRALGTKVRVRPSKKGGTLFVEYYSEEELERLMELFNAKRS
jgi:ParB family chromosome partitioning protein